MIKEPRLAPGKQDMLSRRMYVIRPRPELIECVKRSTHESRNQWRSAPIVVMTEEVPFEEDIEGWKLGILNKCKEAFLRSSIDSFPLTILDRPESLLCDMTELVSFFDRWWYAERVFDYIEILRGCWKTDKCFGVSDKK